MAFDMKKTRIVKEILKIYFFVLTECRPTNVTDKQTGGQTDIQTPHDGIASRGNILFKFYF